jgi:hypothetical protein
MSGRWGCTCTVKHPSGFAGSLPPPAAATAAAATAAAPPLEVLPAGSSCTKGWYQLTPLDMAWGDGGYNKREGCSAFQGFTLTALSTWFHAPVKMGSWLRGSIL